MFSTLQRVLSQKFWPSAGDVDDCWALATLMAIHGVAPWLWLVNVTQFRDAAGRPDDPTKPSPGSVVDAAKAVSALYPQLAIEVSTRWTWAEVLELLKSGRTAYLSVKSGALPAALQFGFTGDHAIAVQFHGGKLRVGNPLARPHAAWAEITEDALKKAALAHSQAGDGINALFMPTAEEAFVTHPLYQAPATTLGPLDLADATPALVGWSAGAQFYGLDGSPYKAAKSTAAGRTSAFGAALGGKAFRSVGITDSQLRRQLLVLVAKDDPKVTVSPVPPAPVVDVDAAVEAAVKAATDSLNTKLADATDAAKKLLEVLA